MARKRNKAWIGTLIFVIVVAQIGVMLEASRHMRNPFQVITDISLLHLDFNDNGRIMTRSQPASVSIQAPIPGVTFVDNTFGEVRWSEFRSVLFDWWFIAAITAFVIVIGRPIGYVFKQIRLALKRSSRTSQIDVSAESKGIL